jgi:hypothetical protein
MLCALAGDDVHSWAVSGFQGNTTLHHSGRKTEGGRGWKEGDVITCVARSTGFSKATLTFSVNGDEPCFSVTDVAIITCLVPVLTIGVGFVGEWMLDNMPVGVLPVSLSLTE